MIADAEGQRQGNLPHQETVDLVVGKRFQGLHDALRRRRLVQGQPGLHVRHQNYLGQREFGLFFYFWWGVTGEDEEREWEGEQEEKVERED